MKKIYHIELSKIIRKARKEGIQVTREGEYFTRAYIINNVKYIKISDIEYQIIEAF